MSADNGSIEELLWYVEVPGTEFYAFVTRDLLYDEKSGLWRYSQTHLELRYDGFGDELLAAGVITTVMLTPPGGGHRNRDPDGRSIRIQRRWKTRGAQPQQYLVVRRKIDAAELPRWPWAHEALAAHDRCDEWHRARFPQRWKNFLPPTALGAPERRANALRLVVDNTRKSS